MTATVKVHQERGLPGPLRRNLNRLAHQAGLATETRLRAACAARLVQAAADGATRAELATLLAGAADQFINQPTKDLS